MLLYNDSEVYQPVYNRLKVYPTFMRLYLFHNPTVERLSGFEERNIKLTNSDKTLLSPEDSLYRSLRRTKTTISDIVLSNKFELFCTFTFKEDRYNIEKCKTKMSKWLNNQQTKYGKFKYLIVPEFHKDKKAIHFHALMSGYRGQLIDSGKTINGRKNYNIKSYKSGFSSAVKIDNHEKVSSYVRKYITKDMPQFNGKKRYWISTGLARPYTEVNTELIHNPFIKWSNKYSTNNLEIYETGSIVKILTNQENNTWHSKHLITSPTTVSLQQSTLSRAIQNQVVNTRLSLSL